MRIKAKAVHPMEGLCLKEEINKRKIVLNEYDDAGYRVLWGEDDWIDTLVV